MPVHERKKADESKGRYQTDRALYPDIHCLLGTVRGTVPHTSPGRHAGAHVSRLGVHNHHRLSCRRDNGCGKALLERDNDKGHHHDVRYILLREYGAVHTDPGHRREVSIGIHAQLYGSEL